MPESEEALLRRAAKTEETWASIPGYEGYYEASSRGRVRGVERVVPTAAGGERRVRGRVLVQHSADRYQTVALSKDNKRKTLLVHRLVALAFLSIPEGDEVEVCHNDGDGRNNTFANLRWDTPSANCLDIIAHGHNPKLEAPTCAHGHAWVPDNVRESRHGNGRTNRHCRSCDRARRWIRGHPEDKDRFQEISDSYFARLPSLTAAATAGPRVACRYGHRLEGANLRNQRTRLNVRACVACGRAYDRIRYHPELHGRFQEVADAYYAELMSKSKEMA